jgi:hypothetical protein
MKHIETSWNFCTLIFIHIETVWSLQISSLFINNNKNQRVYIFIDCGEKIELFLTYFEKLKDETSQKK